MSPDQMRTEQENWAQQYDAQQSAEKAQAEQAKQPPSFLERWTAPVAHATASIVDRAVSEAEQWGTAARRVGQDVDVGLATAAVGAADTVKTAVVDPAVNLSLIHI